MRNWISSPVVMTSARTSRAPIHSTLTTPAKTRAMTMTVITARVAMRLLADRKLSSVTASKRSRAWPS